VNPIASYFCRDNPRFPVGEKRIISVRQLISAPYLASRLTPINPVFSIDPFSFNRLEVIGNLGGKEFSFFLDTGAFSTTLTNGIQDEVKVPYVATGNKLVGPFHDFGKNAQISYAEPSDFKLGAYDASGARVNFTTLNDQEAASHRFAGFIGLDFLYYRSAIIDIGGRALYLKPYSTPH
jgi:hypothetical protein